MARRRLKQIGIITTSRADYSIYLPVAKALRSKGLPFGFYITGSHLSKLHGMTANAIIKDGFEIKARVPCAMGDDRLGMAKTMAQVTSGMAKVFSSHVPSLLLVLGDRYEMHAAALAGVVMGIPLLHLHGGELTQGSMDEYFRHSLTKLANVHACSTDTYAKRIIRMGEDPRHVHVVGAPGLDNALAVRSLTAEQMKVRFALDIGRPYVLITLHPSKMDLNSCIRSVNILCRALLSLKEYDLVFTSPNADPYAQDMAAHMKRFIGRHRRAFWVDNFGTQGYVTAMRHAVAMVGNSSSGIIEAASFGLPVVNLGDRQEGRVRGKNVIDVAINETLIKKSLARAVSVGFHRSMKGLKNPYGDGHAGQRIADVINRLDVKELVHKKFYDKG